MPAPCRKRTRLTLRYLCYNGATKERKNKNSYLKGDKKCQRKLPFDLDLYGKEIPNEFVVGFGFDYNELLRNVPYVYVPSKEEIETLDALNKENN